LLEDERHRVCAVVRSERAAGTLAELPIADQARERLRVTTLNYTDADALTAAARGCDVAVHLVGILKEGSTSTYLDAHERSCEALAAACLAAAVEHVTYLSIVGSRADSANECLASKGRAEDLLRESSIKAAVLRVPMVLGEGDYASRALYDRAQKSRSFTFRATSLEQPIYAGDVVAAIMNAAERRVDAVVDLGGPEVLTRRALTQRAAAVLNLNKGTNVISLPVGLGRLFAWFMEKVSGDPPITPAMLGVLDHDDSVDPELGLETLGLEGLTSLDEMLRNVLQPG
jgi:NADH dehydrogenase